MLNTQLIIDGAKTLHFPLTEYQIDLLQHFFQVYTEATLQMNISTLKDSHDFSIKHVLDIMSAHTYFKKTQSILDIGSGGGFPGIILAILYPSKNFTLIDIIEKKIQYLRTTIRTLKLDNCQALNASKQKIEGSFDTITCRALGNLEKILNISKPYFKKKTRILAYKGKHTSIQEELTFNTHKVQFRIFPLQVPFLEAERNLVILSRKGLKI